MSTEQQWPSAPSVKVLLAPRAIVGGTPVVSAVEASVAVPPASAPVAVLTAPASSAGTSSRQCHGCLMECGNQEAHYGGCLNDPYEDDADEVAREMASFELTFSGGPLAELVDELETVPGEFVDVVFFPWADYQEESGSPEW